MRGLKGKLVVSCQAAPGDPMEDTETIRRIARTVVASGAAGLRLNGPEHVRAVRQDSSVPIIAIQKRYTEGSLQITPDFASAATLAAAGASIIALDCSNRARPNGEPWQMITRRIHEELKLPVMADIATLEEGLAAAEAGADLVGTTLSGYTEETWGNHFFDWALLANLVRRIRVPIIAEGHISTPEEARRAAVMGASCVIVGSAITRPGLITSAFVRALGHGSSTAPAVGVDIGGTSIKAGLVQPTGEVSLATHVPTEAAKGRDAIAAGLCDATEQVLSAASREGIQPAGLGIASAGAISAKDGSVFAATNNLPGWAGFNLRSFAEKRFDLPTWVVNDAHAAVLAELHFGLGRSLSNFVAITIGTGIGGGIVCDGKLVQGQHGFAGSIGHHVIRESGHPCNCGRRGCLEAYVSTAALLREFRNRGGLIPDDPTIDDAALALRINQLAIKDVPAAVGAYKALGTYLAEGIANIFNLFDPEAVLVSGGLVEGQVQFLSTVAQQVADLLHFGSKRQPCVRAAKAGRLAGVQGAATLVFEGAGLPAGESKRLVSSRRTNPHQKAQNGKEQSALVV
jgi:predicted NBD/HSP70 family sugar kinase/putative N-acetylmannosamine-6-phosphate epimerase